MGVVIRGFRIPLRVEFRGVTERAGALIRGPAGWGEFSPFPDYGEDAARRWLDAAMEAATAGWPAPRRDVITVNATIPALDPHDAHDLAAHSGCTTAKIKVGAGDDLGRVEAVRDALGPSGKVRIDANGVWTVDEAVRTIKTLARFDLEYVEQPVASIDDMVLVRKKVNVPVAADESIRNARDPIEVSRRGAADIIVLKVHPLGGVTRALEIADRCGLPVVVSSAVETSVGIAAGLALAAALPELPYACGLGTVPLLGGDVTADSLTPVEGRIAVRRVSPDRSLESWEVPPSALPAAIAGRLSAVGSEGGAS